MEAGSLKDSVEVESAPIPTELEWGQVLLAIKYAPIDAADAYTSLMAGTFSDVTVALPYTAGHHGIASVMKVGSISPSH
jgi:trans-2-enoyl-CoA reductase